VIIDKVHELNVPVLGVTIDRKVGGMFGCAWALVHRPGCRQRVSIMMEEMLKIRQFTVKKSYKNLLP